MDEIRKVVKTLHDSPGWRLLVDKMPNTKLIEQYIRMVNQARIRIKSNRALPTDQELLGNSFAVLKNATDVIRKRQNRLMAPYTRPKHIQMSFFPLPNPLDKENK